MTKFKFIKQKDEFNDYDNTDIIFEVETEQLSDVVEQFELFLKASGYYFGSLVIDKDE